MWKQSQKSRKENLCRFVAVAFFLLHWRKEKKKQPQLFMVKKKLTLSMPGYFDLASHCLSNSFLISDYQQRATKQARNTPISHTFCDVMPELCDRRMDKAIIFSTCHDICMHFTKKKFCARCKHEGRKGFKIKKRRSNVMWCSIPDEIPPQELDKPVFINLNLTTLKEMFVALLNTLQKLILKKNTAYCTVRNSSIF